MGVGQPHLGGCDCRLDLRESAAVCCAGLLYLKAGDRDLLLLQLVRAGTLETSATRPPARLLHPGHFPTHNGQVGNAQPANGQPCNGLPRNAEVGDAQISNLGPRPPGNQQINNQITANIPQGHGWHPGCGQCPPPRANTINKTNSTPDNANSTC